MYTRILVPLDGSKRAEQALPHAVRLATEFGSELVLLRVIPLVPTVKAKDLSPVDFPELEDRERQAATEYLTPIVEELTAKGLKVTTALERRGEPGAAIIDFVEKEKVSLVVMCSHGRSGLARWIYGGVAEKVLHHVPVPVMLVRIEAAQLKTKPA